MAIDRMRTVTMRDLAGEGVSFRREDEEGVYGGADRSSSPFWRMLAVWRLLAWRYHEVVRLGRDGKDFQTD